MTSHLLGWLDRLNAAHAWSHNEAYTGFVLRPARRARRDGGTSALDVGCGTGELIRRLVPLFPTVVGIEGDAATAARAAEATTDLPAVTVMTASFPADEERFDFVSVVAVLHHLPPESGIQAVRAAVAPGGRLVVVGMHREERRDLPWSLVSLLLNPAVGLLRHPRQESRTSMGETAPTLPVTVSYAEIRYALRAAMPGIRVRRGLFWRYTAVWQCADGVRTEHSASQRGKPSGGR